MRTERRCRAGLPWNAREVALLAELYPTRNNRNLAVRFGRSEWAISGKARGLGLTRDHGGGYQRRQSQGSPWSSREMNLLRVLFPIMANEDIAEKIGRSHDAVKMKARQLKLRKMEFWSEGEDQTLRDSYQGHRYDQVAQRLGRTLLAVKARAITLGLEPKVPNWTENEVCFLRDSYQVIDLNVIARELGRTHAAVAEKARQMGLVQYRHWSPEDVQRLREWYPEYTTCEIARRLDYSFDSVRYKARRLGLRKQLRDISPQRKGHAAETTVVVSLCGSVSRD